MTKIDANVQTQYQVQIIKDAVQIGSTSIIADQVAAKEQYADLRRVFPASKLMMLVPGDNGRLATWVEATGDELDRIARVTAAVALVSLQQKRLPVISWSLSEYDPGMLSGSASTREQVEAYADLLGAAVKETTSPATLTVSTSGVFQSARVRVACHLPIEQWRQDADQVEAVAL